MGTCRQFQTVYHQRFTSSWFMIMVWGLRWLACSFTSILKITTVVGSILYTAYLSFTELLTRYLFSGDVAVPSTLFTDEVSPNQRSAPSFWDQYSWFTQQDDVQTVHKGFCFSVKGASVTAFSELFAADAWHSSNMMQHPS